LDTVNTSSGGVIRAIQSVASDLPVRRLSEKTVQGIEARLEKVRTLLYIKQVNTLHEMTISSASHAGSLKTLCAIMDSVWRTHHS
jgi:hypothetical protein